MIKVDIDYENKTARVEGGYTEQYARKVLQDKLKAETPFKGGWECWITNRGIGMDSYFPEGKDFIFKLYNSYASAAGWL